MEARVEEVSWSDGRLVLTTGYEDELEWGETYSTSLFTLDITVE